VHAARTSRRLLLFITGVLPSAALNRGHTVEGLRWLLNGTHGQGGGASGYGNGSSKDHDGRSWNLKRGVFSSMQRASEDRAIGVCMALRVLIGGGVRGQRQMRVEVLVLRVPMVLLTAKDGFVNFAREKCACVAVLIIKDKVYGLTGLLRLVDEQDRPLAIGALDGIRGDEGVASIVAHVGGRREASMRGARHVEPIVVDHLACKKIAREAA
jgi:hypothetical protein